MREDCIPITLGLPEFRVLKVVEDENLITVWVEKANVEGLCPDCGHLSSTVHDARIDDVWDQPIWDKGVLLWVRKRRYLCVNTSCLRHRWQDPFPEQYDSLDLSAHRTKRFDRYIYRLAKRMTNTDVVKELKQCHVAISDQTVGRIYNRLGDEELAGFGWGRVVVIGIDEYSIRKQHTYATIITNPIKHLVLETFPKRDKKTVQAHLEALFPAGQIKIVVMDMSRAFRGAALAAFPEVKIVIDKFHVISVVIGALDETRKRVQRNKPKGQKNPVYRLRYLLRKDREKLNSEEQARLQTILDQKPDLQTAYQLKEAFLDWYRILIPQYATQRLQEWYQQAEATGFAEWQEAVKTIRNWECDILNYFYWRVTNAFTEGSNNTVKVVKRRGYGYRNFDNLRRRILLEGT
jgi:transposase